MTATVSPVKEVLDRFASTQDAKLVPMSVAGTSPLTVYLNGDITVDVPARPLAGAALSVGDTGFALWAPPLPPIVFTATSGSWTNVSYAAGFSSGTGGQLQYRKVGSQVWLQGGADHTTDFTNGQLVATLPTEARPSSQKRFMSFGSIRRAVAVDIQTNGQIIAGWPDPPGSGTSATDPWPTSWVALDFTYLTD